MEVFLLQLFIFLASAAIAVPIARKLGLGSVLGYLIAGIIIGPFGISLIHDTKDIMHFTEFGVVMMLFLVGLELKPRVLWQLRLPIVGMGGAQVIITAVIISAIALQFLPWKQATAIGIILSLSSTAIVLQTLQEKGQMETDAGRSIFSVLLFQDLAIIPILAGLPLLATTNMIDSSHQEATLLNISMLPEYLQILITVLAVLLVVLLGKFAYGPVFRAIASIYMHEIFVAATLALVIGISLLMLMVGLSPVLGAFLTGVMLSDSEFRHELESNIAPFKGLLLGIFFISIGASLNFSLIGSNIKLILAITIGLIAIKSLVMLLIAQAFNINKKEQAFFTIALSQGGEFAFVLFQFSKANGVLSSKAIDPLVSAVVISMFLTPILFFIYEKIARKEKEVEESSQREADVIKETDHKVILVGFGHLGVDVGRLLRSAGIKPVILDHDERNVDLLRKFGFEVYYGDATRHDLLESAGAHQAKLLIITIDDTERAKRLIQLVHKHYPQLKVITNAVSRKAAFEMMDLGVDQIYRDTFATALAIGQAALKKLGIDPYQAHRLSLIFKKKDQEMMPKLHQIRKERDAYIFQYQKHHENLEKLMSLDNDKQAEEAVDKAWTAKNPKT